MFKKQIIIILTFYLSKIFIKNLVISEWIELPQFSDKMKIYRKPSIKFDGIKVNSLFNISKNQFFNITNNTNCDSDEIYSDILLKPSKVLVPTEYDNQNDNRDYQNHDNLTININNMNEEQIIPKIYDNKTNKLENEQVDLSIKINTTTKSSLFELTEENSKSNKKKKSTTYYLLNYIPINHLNRVHQILIENLGKTSKEKLDFLESFKNDLSRTIRVIIPGVINQNTEYSARQKRGSSWDEHDSHMGFPSLEGALLAISFLTFAIYLIRLIMMLMRNLNSNTTSNTIFINRNKRFITPLTEETARIHDYLDEFNSRMH